MVHPLIGGTRPASVLVRRLQVVPFFFSIFGEIRRGGREDCVADLRKWFDVGVPVSFRAETVRGEEVVQPLATEWSHHLYCHLCRSPQARNTASSTSDLPLPKQAGPHVPVRHSAGMGSGVRRHIAGYSTNAGSPPGPSPTRSVCSAKRGGALAGGSERRVVHRRSSPEWLRSCGSPRSVSIVSPPVSRQRLRRAHQ